MLHQIKATQFYTDLVLQKHCKIQGLFKAFECFSSTFQGKFYSPVCSSDNIDTSLLQLDDL